jgi:hypothetical protein
VGTRRLSNNRYLKKRDPKQKPYSGVGNNYLPAFLGLFRGDSDFQMVKDFMTTRGDV